MISGLEYILRFCWTLLDTISRRRPGYLFPNCSLYNLVHVRGRGEEKRIPGALILWPLRIVGCLKVT